jgi:hypothetical protein
MVTTRAIPDRTRATAIELALERALVPVVDPGYVFHDPSIRHAPKRNGCVERSSRLNPRSTNRANGVVAWS